MIQNINESTKAPQYVFIRVNSILIVYSIRFASEFDLFFFENKGNLVYKIVSTEESLVPCTLHLFISDFSIKKKFDCE